MGMPIADRLEKKRTLLEWLRYQAAVTEREIHELEAQDAEEKRRREVARREQAWVVSAPQTLEGHSMLHRGNCGLRARCGAGELLDLDGVMGAVEEYTDLEMCDVCAPRGSLGIDKPADRPARPAEVEFP
ncbi:hypothetical protein [Streptomyces sp. NBC_00572]|uniref:hypothetical protein n=1 Tax=Streptomyces sp. NBC_00572 TaxID=2903664 RepID=UPI0022513B09|nr:hypothetical protein [Streptomyces sp. NBC_00572]MCX4984554.1 hypothetical protein [Streptomyces sp. NBC_00572]